MHGNAKGSDIGSICMHTACVGKGVQDFAFLFPIIFPLFPFSLWCVLPTHGSSFSTLVTQEAQLVLFLEFDQKSSSK